MERSWEFKVFLWKNGKRYGDEEMFEGNECLLEVETEIFDDEERWVEFGTRTSKAGVKDEVKGNGSGGDPGDVNSGQSSIGGRTAVRISEVSSCYPV